MNERNICNKRHTKTASVMYRVPHGQHGVGRHKCAACAYEKGLEHGQSPEPNFDLETYLAELPESQRDTWRHKDTAKAYELGVLHGKNKSHVINGICKKTHRDAARVMTDVEDNQGGIGRHKCAACAYDKGFEHGLFPDYNFDLDTYIAKLPESQRDTWRHKDPKSAYLLGVQHGSDLMNLTNTHHDE